MAEKFDLNKYTSDALIAALERTIKENKNPVFPMPWHTAGPNRNFNSKRPYRGFVNQLLLGFQGFAQPYWATYSGWQQAAYREWAKANKVKIEDADLNAIKDKRVKNTENVKAFWEAGGGGVKKGEHGTLVTYNAKVPNKKYDKDDKESGPKYFWFLRYYRVFNIEQTTGITIPEPPAELDFKPIEEAERIWNEWEDKPEVKVNGNRAYYTWADPEHIGMPDKKLFKSEDGYYATLFHEGVHATGHESRLNRFGTRTGKPGEKYSYEELIAEMGSAMLCAHAGIDNEQRKKASVAYMRGWITVLQDDIKMAAKASTKAAAAVDNILGVEYENGDNE